MSETTYGIIQREVHSLLNLLCQSFGRNRKAGENIKVKMVRDWMEHGCNSEGNHARLDSRRQFHQMFFIAERVSNCPHRTYLFYLQ